MRNALVKFAKLIYRLTPSSTIRRVYFRAFCALVRGRQIQASIDGINYSLDLGETIDVAIFLGGFEKDVCDAIDKFCGPGQTILDIGANIGAHTLRLAKNAKDGGSVYAFEPTAYAFEKLTRNISLNDFKNIIPQRLALSDQRRPDVSASIKSRWPTNGAPAEEISRFDCMRLDDWLRENRIEKIDLIKLDVDGNEYAVIAGGLAALAFHGPPILMEVWGPNFSDQSKNPFNELEKLGYQFFDLTTGGRYETVGDLQNKVSKGGKLMDYSINIIARRDRVERPCQ
jgi:FkbM family methyltransferase